jgi:tetratricopeptide (TPR) repeat protein
MRVTVRAALAGVAAAFLSVTPAVVWCQGQGLEAGFDDARFAVVDSLHVAGNVAGAIEVLESLLSHDPDDVVVLLKATREAIVAGIVSDDREVRDSWYRRGEQYAARAREVAPDDEAALYWLIAAQGRRAVHSPALTAARLGVSVYEGAQELLAGDSLHAGANHALGVLNYEVMKLSSLERFLARTLAPHRILRDTSWENAEFRLRRAVDLEPGFPLYLLDLGKAYFVEGKFELARETLQSLFELPPVDPPADAAFRAEAREYLQRIP